MVVALPEDVLSGQSAALPLSGPIAVEEAAPGAGALDALRGHLEQAERPLIMLGGVNWQEPSQRAMEAFAEANGIPVVTAFRYQDCFDNFSPVFCGEAGVGMPAHVQRLIREADAILTRLPAIVPGRRGPYREPGAGYNGGSEGSSSDAGKQVREREGGE